MSEKFYHPAFGWLTDEEDIRIAKRQQSEDDYYRAMHESMLDQEAHEYSEWLIEMHSTPIYEDNPITFEEWCNMKYQSR